MMQCWHEGIDLGRVEQDGRGRGYLSGVGSQKQVVDLHWVKLCPINEAAGMILRSVGLQHIRFRLNMAKLNWKKMRNDL